MKLNIKFRSDISLHTSFNAIIKSLRIRRRSERWHAILLSHLFRYTTIYLSPFEFRIFGYVPSCAFSLKFRHIYSIGRKYSLAHQKIASTTFEWTRSCADFHEIENFNIKYLCREQATVFEIRDEHVNAHLRAKTGWPKVIHACSSYLICLVSEMIYVSKSIICSLILG